MLHVQAVVVLLLVEVAGVSLLALLVWAAVAMRRRTRDRRAVEDLVASIQAADAERRAGLTEALAGAGLSDEALEERVTTLVRGEHQLYKTLIATYLTRDPAAFTTIDDSVSGALAPYRALIVPPPGTAGEDLPELGDGQLESLRADNDALRDELETTRRTMSNMLNEYAQMYERGDGAAQGTTARTILSAAASGQPEDGQDAGPETLATFDGSLDTGVEPSTDLDDDGDPGDETAPSDDGTDPGDQASSSGDGTDPGDQAKAPGNGTDPGDQANAPDDRTDPGDQASAPGDAAAGDGGDIRAA